MRRRWCVRGRSNTDRILDIVENASGEVEKADEAERRAIEAVRQLGNEIVQGWAQRQHQKKEHECDQKVELSRKKKTLYWLRVFGKIQIEEQIFRRVEPGRPCGRSRNRQKSSAGAIRTGCSGR